MTDGLAFQDDVFFKGNQCVGCGNENPHGLKIKSYWDGNESICTWKPEDFHTAGWPNVLYGGIISGIIDCHCMCTIIICKHYCLCLYIIPKSLIPLTCNPVWTPCFLRLRRSPAGCTPPSSYLFRSQSFRGCGHESIGAVGVPISGQISTEAPDS